MCFHPCQSICWSMSGVDTPLYKQSSKRITAILTTQHPNDRPAWMDENWHIFSLGIGWCVTLKLRGLHLNFYQSKFLSFCFYSLAQDVNWCIETKQRDLTCQKLRYLAYASNYPMHIRLFEVDLQLSRMNPNNTTLCHIAGNFCSHPLSSDIALCSNEKHP